MSTRPSRPPPQPKTASALVSHHPHSFACLSKAYYVLDLFPANPVRVTSFKIPVAAILPSNLDLFSGVFSSVYPTVSLETFTPSIACAGATLTAPYNGYNYEQEAVVSDPGLFQVQVTGGPPGNGLDGTSPIRASLPPHPLSKEGEAPSVSN